MLDRARAGELRLLYVAPERFSSPGFLEALREVPIGLFVVDEAHCVSQWGHDFRPDYFRLADAARWLGAQAVVASTATATPQVAADIERRLGLREPVRVATGFDRPNLTFAVVPCRAPADVSARLAGALADPAARPGDRLRGHPRAVRARRHRPRAPRSASRSPPTTRASPRERRATVQRRFMDGDLDVVVATNAFGMGVDKANVRTVAHVSVPPSLEAWYQEAGRAGRDGLPARALLLAQAKDKGLHVFFIERAELSGEEIDRVAERLLATATDGRIDADARRSAPSPSRCARSSGISCAPGSCAPSPAPMDRVRGRIEAPYDGRARATCRTSAADGIRARWGQYRSIWSFVEGDGCRRAAILRHFGDPATPSPGVPCCDVCAPESVADVTSITVSRGARGADGGGAAGRAARRTSRRPTSATSTRRSSTSSSARSPRSAAPAPSRSSAAAARRSSPSTATTGCPPTGRSRAPAPTTCSHASTSCIAEGRLASTGGRFPKLAATA